MLDTPSVGVSVSIDGKTKRVVREYFSAASSQDVQNQFLQIAHEIEMLPEPIAG
jgi:hypothetical protein